MTNPYPQRIARLSRIMKGLCLLGFVGIPALLAAVWAFGSEAFLRSGEPAFYLVPHGVSFELGRLDAGLRWAGFAVSMLPGCVMMLGLWHLSQLFADFRRLDLFTADSVRHFRWFALTVLASGLVKPLAGALMSVVTSYGNTAGQRNLSVTAGDAELTAIFVGLVLLVIAWVLEQGRRIAEENREFV